MRVNHVNSRDDFGKREIYFLFIQLTMWGLPTSHVTSHRDWESGQGIYWLCHGERQHMCARFGLGDKSLLTHWPTWRWQVFIEWKFSHACNFSCLGECNPKFLIKVIIILNKVILEEKKIKRWHDKGLRRKEEKKRNKRIKKDVISLYRRFVFRFDFQANMDFYFLIGISLDDNGSIIMLLILWFCFGIFCS